MRRGNFKIMIQISPSLTGRATPAAPPSPISSSDSESEDSSSSSASGDVQESLKDMMESLKQQMSSIESASRQIDGQMSTICNRAREEDSIATPMDWTKEQLVPLSDGVRDWLALKGVPDRPTLKEFMNAVLDAASSVDLESRCVTMSEEDAAVLWAGQRQITVFQMIGLLPVLFRDVASAAE